MGLVAILVNCGLIALSGQVQRMFPEMSATQTILLIVALEHIMLAIRFVIICAIPDIPNWVATEMAKVEFLRREAVRRLSSTPSPEQQPPTVIGNKNLSNESKNVPQIFNVYHAISLFFNQLNRMEYHTECSPQTTRYHFSQCTTSNGKFIEIQLSIDFNNH